MVCLEDLIVEIYKRWEVVAGKHQKIEKVRKFLNEQGFPKRLVIYDPRRDEAYALLSPRDYGIEYAEKLEDIITWLYGQMPSSVAIRVTTKKYEFQDKNPAIHEQTVETLGLTYLGCHDGTEYFLLHESEGVYILLEIMFHSEGGYS